ncbi:MAG: sigma-E processing peptidase SpoIIGA [Acutalibacteraceae bacterium]|nr:sigma-E processing peptidase SpoIIGA [Acutalibacteraceae bacterium]
MKNVTVYADVMFIVNLIVNYLLLLSVSGIVHNRPPFWRLLISAAIGAAASFVILLPPMNFFVNILIKAALCLIMTATAFPIKNIKSLLRHAAWLLFITFSYCGIVTAIVMRLKPKMIHINNMAVYADLSPLLLIISTAVCYLAVKGIILVAAKVRPREDFYTLEIFRGNHSIKCTALLDTGCNLHDLFSGSPVIVLEQDLALSLIPQRVAALGNDGADSICENMRNGIRLIPYSAIGGKGMMQAYMPDKVIISQKNKSRELHDITVAVSKEPFEGEFRAVIGSDIANML